MSTDLEQHKTNVVTMVTSIPQIIAAGQVPRPALIELLINTAKSYMLTASLDAYMAVVKAADPALDDAGQAAMVSVFSALVEALEDAQEAESDGSHDDVAIADAERAVLDAIESMLADGVITTEPNGGARA